MERKNVERYLNSFGKQVVAQAKANLTQEKGDTALGGSIRFGITKEFTVQFFMDSYGKFLDKGVSGTDQQRDFTNQDGQKEKSPFKYTSKQPPTGILELWIKKKGMKGRKALRKHRKKDKNGNIIKETIKGAGQFITHKSFAFAIAKTIKRKGIKGLSFFQKPMGFAMKNFDALYGQALKQDIEEAWNKVAEKFN